MNEMFWVHMIMAGSALLPSALMKLINPDGTRKGIGYNTPSAHRSVETSTFANRYATKGMFWAGLGTITIQATLYFLVPDSTAILVTAGVMTFSFLTVVGLTERQISLRFDKEGKPKADYSEY